jgi:arginyl-tRNA synthetase
MYKTTFYQDLEEYLAQHHLSKKIVVNYSDFEDFQYQTPLCIGNKDIDAQHLKSFLLQKKYYKKIEITGKGFISVQFFLQEFPKIPHKPKTVVIDYCGVNVAKKMHIGHIRSMFIGDYISHLHQSQQNRVIKVNHIGDWGNQFGYLLHYILQNQLTENLNNELLTQYYKKAYELYQIDPIFAKQSEHVAYLLQNHLDQKIYHLWKKCVDISLQEAENIFDLLHIGLSLQDTQGESFYAPFCKDIVTDLLNKKIAIQEKDQSVVVFFDKKSPLIIQKSNGNFLYPLYDLAALKWRQENLHPDKIIYVVDKRQSLHFEQIFEIAKKAQYVQPFVELKHVGFGTILGKDKKPLKTKSGDSLYLENLIEEGKNFLQNSEYFQKLEPIIQEQTLMKNLIGGLKFYDLKFNKSQDYVFDWNFVLNFQGNSAPYIQNALVRMDSIFEKKGLNIENHSLDSFSYSSSWNPQEQTMIFQIQKCQEIIEESLIDYPSQTLTENIIHLCQLFYQYYETDKIIGHLEEDKKLQLLHHIYVHMKNYLSILGIESFRCEKYFINHNQKPGV